MALSLNGVVRNHYNGIPRSFSVINDVLSRAKYDVGEQTYRTAGGVSLLRLLSALEQMRPPLDLVWIAVDDNGFPLNPKWRYQVVTGLFPDPPTLCTGPAGPAGCTSQQLSSDAAPTCLYHSFWQIPGHLNWFPITHKGDISWDSKSTNGTDDDYNVKFFPPDNAGLTAASASPSKGFIELEFDSDETIDHFDTPWWNAFHNAVDNDNNAAHQMMDGRFAIVTGLFGLDCVHSVTTESHPVWAMAILVKEDPSDQVWAMFVRNWGNEGWCSTQQWYMPGQSYTFRLRWEQEATSVSIRKETIFHANNPQIASPKVQYAPNEGVLVTFTLPPPQAGALVDGELHLQWQ